MIAQVSTALPILKLAFLDTWRSFGLFMLTFAFGGDIVAFAGNHTVRSDVTPAELLV